MKPDLPAWALQPAAPADHALAVAAQQRGQLRVRWPESKALRAWAKRHGWPAPVFGFEDAFLGHMLLSPENFALALAESGLALQFPRRDYALPPEELAELDALYAERGSDGRPSSWGSLVAALREIRRAVEAGVSVQVAGGPSLTSWQGFYDWAHGRYHMLEDGYDDWIGHDD
jgi:hypothetical protein